MNRRRVLAGAVATFLGRTTVASPTSEARDGDELLGKAAPNLSLAHWLNSRPLEMTDLRGKVVLLRWWTQGCPFCTATAPALTDLQNNYGPEGFQVVGIYHPKPSGNWSMDAAALAAKEKHFTFPIALDGDWNALKHWWLTRDRDFTSVSFLVDRSGIIRYVHPGGEFHDGQQGGLATHAACNRDLRFIKGEIARLLA